MLDTLSIISSSAYLTASSDRAPCFANSSKKSSCLAVPTCSTMSPIKLVFLSSHCLKPPFSSPAFPSNKYRNNPFVVS